MISTWHWLKNLLIKFILLKKEQDVSVCLCEAKNISNRWTNMVLTVKILMGPGKVENLDLPIWLATFKFLKLKKDIFFITL